jgi:hypothetical protein
MRVKRQERKRQLTTDDVQIKDKTGWTTQDNKEKRYSDDMMDKRQGTDSEGER